MQEQNKHSNKMLSNVQTCKTRKEKRLKKQNKIRNDKMKSEQ